MKIAGIAISLVFIILTIGGCASAGGQPAASSAAAADIYAQISPSIAFIDTPAGTGSGIYIQGGYIVTCAHVVWPFTDVRVVFPSGIEFQTPVLNMDLMADIAILGPLYAPAPQLSLASTGTLNTGDTVFVIGYPGETDSYPQPALSRGLISRLRYWESQALTYIQTDAASTGGASGGVLVSGEGEAIGMIGFTYAKTFGLAASAGDMSPRVQGLIRGDDVDGLGSRALPTYGGQPAHRITLEHELDRRIFVIRPPAGTAVDINADSGNDVALWLLDVNGAIIAEADANYSGTESLSATTEYDAPYFLIVGQYSDSAADVHLTANCALIPLADADDGKNVAPGQVIAANIDCPGDWDWFTIDLDAFQTVTIAVDSISIDAYIEVWPASGWYDDVWHDDDSGGGLFGTNAELTFTAPQSGRYYISVSDYSDEWMGGYILSVE